nr:uncharacterized protein LOC121118580 [Lepeophtheirus salmonis]
MYKTGFVSGSNRRSFMSHLDPEGRKPTNKGVKIIGRPEPIAESSPRIELNTRGAKTPEESSSNITVRSRSRNHLFRSIFNYPVSISVFHVYFSLGLVGFILFWTVLMLRVYLPESYWKWSYDFRKNL